MSDTTNDLSLRHPDGSRVTCVVTRVEPFGVFVRLGDDATVTGFIRPRDWSFARRIFDLAAEVETGQEIEAEVIGRRGPKKLELSRRRVLPDPFPAFVERHRTGDVVLAQVSLVAANETGVLVALDDGVEGFVPREEIPDTREEGFGLFVQDWVAGRILGFRGRQVRLSIKEYLRERAREEDAGDDTQGALGHHPELGPGLEDMRLRLELGEIEEPSLSDAVRDRVRRVLVVEDSANVSESLAMVFDHFELPCDRAESLEAAREYLETARDSLEAARDSLGEMSYDLLILDVNLSIGSGLELVRELRRQATEAIVFVLTATAAEDWQAVVQAAPNADTRFFQKPTRISRLFEELERLVSGRVARDDRAFKTGLDPRGSPEVRAASGRSTGGTERIAEALASLAESTRASHAFVLGFRPGPHFELVAGNFPGELDREVQQELEISPVGDVIQEKRFIFVPDVAAEPKRFKHLLTVHPVGSFAGFPLAYSDQGEYGLFLFGEAPHALRDAFEKRLRTAALLIGHDIAEKRLDQAITENQSLLLTGFLSDSLLHEIKNELQALSDYSAVQVLVTKKHKDDLTGVTRPEALELKRSVLGVQAVSKRLDELVVLFRNLAGQPGEESLDVNAAVVRLVATVKPFADAQGVRVATDLDPELPHLHASPKLIDQSLLNLMINAVEQMGQLPKIAGARRKLEVRTRVREDGERSIEIRVIDNGRGVHWVHREKIFDLFFTTKERGTGLGLYLARFFIEQLGGRLRLAKSVLVSGSEFVIELPLRSTL